ncbi:MAG: transketolase [Kiritimatiellia bacterium]
MKNITTEDLKLTANTIRGLAIDTVEKAASGHPGMPMGMADAAAVLFLGYLEISADKPDWINRDRFVLSAGHASALLYSLLHLSGYDLPLSELAAFRQWGSRTPGHPEYGRTPGVETTTGPLAQGCGNAVGMAIAEQVLAEQFNTQDFDAIDHYTYVMASDGDLMEGLSHEAFSLAGHLGLAKLIVLYDDNNITIEGKASLACSDNVKKRFQAYNWNVIEADGHNCDEIERAIRRARRSKTRPSLIVLKTHIAFGSPNMQDNEKAHGSPLGPEETALAKKNLGIPEGQEFYVPDRVRELFAGRRKTMKKKVSRWERRLKRYFASAPEREPAWRSFFDAEVPADLDDCLPRFDPGKPDATRSSSGEVLQKLAERMPCLIGGSADLAPSTKTLIKNGGSIAPGRYEGRNIHFGIREHAMCAALNGIALHGGLRPYGSTFFVFLDYCRPSVRLAAMMKLPVIFVFTHDSFGVGEDGPTHQPVEHLASLRSIPGITVIRPADSAETAAAWAAALRNTDGPTALILSRQKLPTLDRSVYGAAAGLAKGAYTLWQSAEGTPEVILMATGSEVPLVLAAAEELAKECTVRVLSIPSWELFQKQDPAYRDDVLPPACKRRVAVEAGIAMGWERYTGPAGSVISMDAFGASAPYKILMEKFGFTPRAVIDAARETARRA